jgi:hypothetical protein
MDVRRGRARPGLALLGVVVLGACGGEAESAGDDESTPLPAPSAPVQEAPAAAPEVPVAPALQPAPEPTAPAPTRPRQTPPSPQRQPERVIPVGTPTTPPDADPEAESPPAAETRRILAAGRTLDLSAVAEITTESARVGDVVHAAITEDVLGSAGEVLLPAGTQLTGRVAESRESTTSEEPGVLRLEFESITVNGAERPLKATVVEMAVDAQARDSNTRTAAKVGIGAAAGAIVGRIVGGDRSSAVKGAVVGGVAGGAAAAVTRSGHATLGQGAKIVIRLDEALVIDG